MFYPFEKYLIAQDALFFLIFFPSIVITLCSLCMNRRRNDPARRALTFLKAAFAFFTLFVFLSFCSDSLSIASIRLQDDRGLSDYWSNPHSLIRNIQYASAQTWAVGRLVECITDLLVFIMLVRLGIGILIAFSGKPDGSAKALKLASLGIAAVLTIIAIARFGLTTRYYSIIYSTNYSGLVPGSNAAKVFMNARRLDFAFYVLVFVLSLAIVGQSIMVKTQTSTEQRVSVASSTFIACAVLWLLRSVYNMASTAALVNFSDFSKDKDYKNYFYILDIVFGVIPQLVLLSLAFGLGQKKLNGLWSTEQTFMVNQGDGVTPWGFSYDPNQVPGAAPAAAHQQQQQSPPQPQMQQDWSQYQQQQYHQQQFQQQQQQFQQQVQPQQYQQYQQPQYQAYNPHLQQQATQPHQYTPVSPLSSEASHAASPPPHDVAMGLNHQANGSPPQPPQPYYEKS